MAPRRASRLLPAYVEIMLAAGDIQAARVAADELATLAGDLDAPMLNAVAAQARGAVRLAEGDARAALPLLRQAWTAWQEVEAAYEAARVRVLIGLASRDLGDMDAAEMEFDAARWIFEQLGARPDLARVEAFSRSVRPRAAGGLSAREIQVLRLVAAGKTNRADRLRALHQREDRRTAPEQHLQQARPALAGGCHGVRVRTPVALILVRRNTHSSGSAKMSGPPDVRSVPPCLSLFTGTQPTGS